MGTDRDSVWGHRTYAGKGHARERVGFVRDPGIRHGRWRVLERTDGRAVVVETDDDGQPHMGQSPIFIDGGADRVEACAREAKRLHETDTTKGHPQ